MCSELSVGHHRAAAAATRSAESKTVPGGLLGADYSVENGRYRFTKVYGGLNWNPELRSPLTEPGVNVKAGEYLLAVGGRDRASRRPTSTASSRTPSGKIVEITVGPNADGSGIAHRLRSSRSRNEARAAQPRLGRGQPPQRWTPRRAAASRTSTSRTPAAQGYTYFKRYFYPQSHKDAVIVDERLQRRRQRRRLLHRHPAAVR